MPLKKLPHQVVGRNVVRRFPQEPDGVSSWPRMPAALDRNQHHFRPVLPWPIGRSLDGHAIVGLVWLVGDDRRFGTAVRFHPGPDGMLDGEKVRTADALPFATAKGCKLVVGAVEVRSPISIATGGRVFLEENLRGSPKAEARAGAVVE